MRTNILLTYVYRSITLVKKGEQMQDYADPLINAREFLRRTEESLLANNYMGAYHHAMQAFREVEALLDYCLDKTKELS